MEEVNASNPRFLQRAEELIKNEPLNDLKVYLKFQLLNTYASSLGEDWFNLNFNFYKKVFEGTERPLPLEERTTQLTSNKLGEALGKIYVEKYFSLIQKERVLRMVEAIIEALIEKINQLDWMLKTTKLKAIEKINKMVIEIGYPNDQYWTDYSDLTFESRKPHIEHCLALAKFNFNEEMNKLKKPIDKKK